MLVGTDTLLGLAPGFLAAAAQLPDGAQTLGEAVDLGGDRDLLALESLEAGLHGYRFDEGSGAWRVHEPASDVSLELR